MTRRVYLYFAVTAVLGAVLGGVAVYYFLWHMGRVQHPSGFRRDIAVQNLKKRLDLSEDQATKVGQIFDESSQKVRDLQRQIDPQFHAIHLETRAKIREILNPDQATKFDAYVKEIDARHHRRSATPPPASAPSPSPAPPPSTAPPSTK